MVFNCFVRITGIYLHLLVDLLCRRLVSETFSIFTASCLLFQVFFFVIIQVNLCFLRLCYFDIKFS